MTLRLFGYGSLLFAPELPDDVVEVLPARLVGHRRAFNKLSTTRRCPREESHDAFPAPDPRLVEDGAHRSLVLGTDADERAAIDGMVIVYRDASRERVLRATDAREGVAAGGRPELDGYVRVTCTVTLGRSGEAVEADTYLTNPHPLCVHRASLSLGDQARAIVNATPRIRCGPDDSRGVHYLEGVRASLLAVGVVDTELERLAEAIRSLPGPWTEHVTPPG